VDATGNVYVTDRGNSRIQKFTSDGTCLTQWGTFGTGDGQFGNPLGVAVDGSGDTVYVADSWNNRIQKFTSDGTYLTQWGTQGTGDRQFDDPHGVAVDASGNAYVTDYNNARVQKFTSSGTFILKWGTRSQLGYPACVAVVACGYVYVADCENERIQKFASDSTLIETVPVLVSLVRAEVTAGGVKLAWFMGGSESGAATVYRSPVGGEWARIGEITVDGTGYLRYTDPIDATTTRVGYRLGIAEAGIEGFYGEAWVDLPTRNPALTFALAPARPNPSHGERLSVAFTLPTASTASLELLDVSGRRVVEREVGSLGAGQHALDLGAGQHLAPGLYLVRLTQGTNTRTTRVAVLK
jgi:hypothetical protein